MNATLANSRPAGTRSLKGPTVGAKDVPGPGPRIDAAHLERYCFRADDQRLADLTSLLAAVRLADRSATRKHARVGWARELQVRVEVADFAFWREPEVNEALTDALDFLTGDRWAFKFGKRRAGRGPRQEHLVSPPNQPRAFLPFSNGLDSVAIAYALQASEPSLELVLVNVRAKDKPRKWESLGRANGRPFMPVEVATYSPDPHRAEPTFRSRPFMFDLLAGYGAARMQPAYVAIPENGQGSIGGSLVPLGGEAPHRACHPGFTSKLSRIIELVTGEHVDYLHPALFRTKGQVLAGLAQTKKNAAEWLTHRSCSYDVRHASEDGRARHCGTCGNCLLRRMSLLWADVDDTTKYLAQDLHARTLQEAFHGAPKSLKSVYDLALNSVTSMDRMANLADAIDGMRVQAEVVALARGLGEPLDAVNEKMEAFLKQHQTEWNRFLQFCGPNSWVAQLAKA